MSRSNFPLDFTAHVVHRGGSARKALTPDRRFRLVNAYAEAAGYFAGFPNFHEADYGQGVVGGVHLLRDTVTEFRDVPRDTHGVYHIEDVPGLFRGAADYAAAHGYPAAFPIRPAPPACGSLGRSCTNRLPLEQLVRETVR